LTTDEIKVIQKLLNDHLKTKKYIFKLLKIGLMADWTCAHIIFSLASKARFFIGILLQLG
jgi:hypothetical protein